MRNNIGLITWIKTYPAKALLFLLLFIFPLIILFLIGININRSYNGFYFDKDENDKPIVLYNKNITKQKILDEYFNEFTITLKEVNSTTHNDEEIEYGRFKFEINYETTNMYKDAMISFRYVMSANWFKEQTNPTSSTTIEFPHNLPKHKFLVFKVNKPVLYVEIKIDKQFSGVNQSRQDILYYKLDLNNVKYDNVK